MSAAAVSMRRYPDSEGFNPRALLLVEGLLAWHFDTMIAGVDGGDHSPHAAAMERAYLFGFSGRKCRTCLGDGYAQLKYTDRDGKTAFMNVEKGCLTCGGSGEVDAFKHPPLQLDLSSVRCARCKGNGESAPKLRALLDYHGLVDPGCPRCESNGYYQPIDAIPGPALRSGGGYEMNESQISWGGILTDALSLAISSYGPTGDVLRLLCGAEGAKQGALEGRRREFAVWPLTDAGAELIRRGKYREADKPLHPLETLWAQCERNRVTPQPERTAQIGQAGRDAMTMVRSARAALWQADIKLGRKISRGISSGEVDRIVRNHAQQVAG